MYGYNNFDTYENMYYIFKVCSEILSKMCVCYIFFSKE